MAIVVEDGSGTNSSANCYVDVAGVRAYADARKLTLPEADGDVEPLIINATDYLEAFRAQYQGIKTSPTQPLQWPREDVFIDGSCDEFPNDEIPSELIKAQCELVCTFAAGVDPSPVQTGQFITSEQIDVIKTTYSEKLGTTGLPTIPKVDDYLSPLLSSGFGELKVGRG